MAESKLLQLVFVQIQGWNIRFSGFSKTTKLFRTDKIVGKKLQPLELLKVKNLPQFQFDVQHSLVLGMWSVKTLKVFPGDWNAFRCRDFQRTTWYSKKKEEKVDFYDHLSVAQVRVQCSIRL